MWGINYDTHKITFKMKSYKFKNQLRTDVMSIFNAIKNQYTNKGEAMKQAWLVAKAKQALKAGEVVLTFTKRCEEIPTVRFGTLSSEFISYESKGTGRKKNASQIAYFEQTSKQFKSFIASNLVQFRAVA